MDDYVILDTFESFNARRYGSPWVCAMGPRGSYDFSSHVGTYTGDARKGEAGDLVVFNPVVGQVYGYGRKDYRGNSTYRAHAIWDGEKFVRCDKLGRIKEAV